jgi:selenophosphate synthase
MSDKEKLSSSKINSNEKITDIFKRKYDFLKDSLKNRIRLNLDIFDSNKKPIQNISIPKKQNEIKKLSFQKPEVSEKEKTI